MEISLATWNLECFQHPTETPKSIRKRIYPKKLAYIVNVIVNKLNLPDIIGFQEITGPTEIEEFMERGTGPQRQVPKSLAELHEQLNAHAPYSFYYSNYRSRGKRVAIFVKHPLVKSETDEVEIYDLFGPESHISYPWVEFDTSNNKLRVFEYGDPRSWHEAPGKFIRPPMNIRIPVGDKHLQIFISQLKSKRPRYDFENLYPNIEGSNRTRRHIPMDPCEEARGKMRSLLTRAQEACQLRFLVHDKLNKFPEDRAIVLADLGDDIESITSQMMEEYDENCHQNIIESCEQRLQLTNLSSLIQPDKKFSYIFNNLKEQHDHILVSKDLASSLIPLESATKSSIDDGQKIFVWNDDIHKKSLVPEGYEYVPDHAPVMIKLNIE